jgi:Ran GTPase-activating protein (RanGAP) involved in mRNA processing and transport
VCEALKSENCELTSLDLTGNRITDKDFEYLCEVLKSEHCKLTSLNLAYNEIGDQGIRYLRDALKSKKCKLTSLDLDFNKLTHSYQIFHSIENGKFCFIKPWWSS